jgi:hypothetical protein
MIGWELYVKRRGIDIATFFKGCASIEQAKQRIESKRVKPPDDATIAKILESIEPIESVIDNKVISLEIREIVNVEKLPVLILNVDPPTIIDAAPINDDEDQLPKRGKGRRKKQTGAEEVADEEDGHG